MLQPSSLSGWAICWCLVLLILVDRSMSDFSVKLQSSSSDSSVKFSELTEIISVSSPAPHLLQGDLTSKNSMVYKGGKALDCSLPVTIFGKKSDGSIVKYKGTVDVAKVDVSNVAQGVTIKHDDKNKLKQFVDELKKNYNVISYSHKPHGSGGKPELSLVLKDKVTDDVLPRNEVEKIIADKLKVLKSDIISERPDCYAVCKDICDSVIVLDVSAEAIVPTATSNVEATATTKWSMKCGKDALDFNDGFCKSKGNKLSDLNLGTCKCKVDDKSPKCPTLTRSYTGTSSVSIFTKHYFGNDHKQSQSMSLSFQFAGECKRSADHLCTIVQLESAAKSLMKVQLGRVTDPSYTTASLPKTPPDAGKTVLYSDRYVQTMQWLNVIVSAKLVGNKLTTTTLFCSIEDKPVCLERTAESTLAGDLKLSNAVVRIGGYFNGCFRNARLNGRIVDLTYSASTHTKAGCHLQDASCGGASSHTCGSKSVCYGRIGYGAGDTCNCRCSGSTRMDSERISNPTKCAASCSKKLPILSTSASSYSASWAMQSGGAITLPYSTHLTLRFLIKTGRSGLSNMLTVKSGSGSQLLTIKIENEVLKGCVRSSCFSFMPKAVSDNYWHEVEVRVASSQLVTRVDNYATVHTLSSPETSFSSVKVSMELPSSCISNLRVSDMYMPTSTTDSTVDSSGEAIKLTAGGGVSSGGSCST